MQEVSIGTDTGSVIVTDTGNEVVIKNETTSEAEDLKRLREDIAKYLSEVKQLEERAEILRSKTMIENIAPAGDYVFARRVIDNEIVRLEISYKALRDLIISIQDRQEQSYNELVKADNGCKNDAAQLSERLSKKIEDVKSSSEDSLRKTKDEFTRAVDKLQGELKGVADGLYGELNRIQSELKGAFKLDIDSLQSEFKMMIDSYQNKNKRSFVDMDEDQRRVKDNIKRIEHDQDVSLSALALYINELAEILDVKTKLTKLGLNNTMERLINRKK